MSTRPSPVFAPFVNETVTLFSNLESGMAKITTQRYQVFQYKIDYGITKVFQDSDYSFTHNFEFSVEEGDSISISWQVENYHDPNTNVEGNSSRRIGTFLLNNNPIPRIPKPDENLDIWTYHSPRPVFYYNWYKFHTKL